MKPKLLTNSDLFIAFFMINRVRYYSFTDKELDFIPSVSLKAGINYDIKILHGAGERKLLEKTDVLI